jgi:hypothetical protein
MGNSPSWIKEDEMDIEALRADLKKKYSGNRLLIMYELIQLYQASYTAQNFSCALKAIELLAKELGYLNAARKRFENLTLEDLSNEELTSLLGEKVTS